MPRKTLHGSFEFFQQCTALLHCAYKRVPECCIELNLRKCTGLSCEDKNAMTIKAELNRGLNESTPH